MNKLIVLLLLLPTVVFAQTTRLKEYKASNGITYKVGDEITLGKGSDTNGKFVYVNIGGWAVSSNPEANRLGAANAGLIVTIKKIVKNNSKRNKGIRFTVGGGNLTNYTMDIENAIKTCEIEDCIKDKVAEKTEDKYDKLKKVKALYDEGILSEEEYKAEKAKILGT